jgi:chromosomal replication initiation ATPase DnaA
MRNISEGQAMNPTIAQITEAVAAAFHVRPADITGKSHKPVHAYPRFIACAISHDAGYSYPIIAHRMGWDYHTRAMICARRAAAIAKIDSEYRNTLGTLRAALIGPVLFYRAWQFKSIRSAQ